MLSIAGDLFHFGMSVESHALAKAENVIENIYSSYAKTGVNSNGEP
jgi:hypothetical protein